jgi:hypothetical protein
MFSVIFIPLHVSVCKYHHQVVYEFVQYVLIALSETRINFDKSETTYAFVNHLMMIFADRNM